MKTVRSVVLTMSLCAAMAVPVKAQFESVGVLDFPTSATGDVEHQLGVDD